MGGWIRGSRRKRGKDEVEKGEGEGGERETERGVTESSLTLASLVVAIVGSWWKVGRRSRATGGF